MSSLIDHDYFALHDEQYGIQILVDDAEESETKGGNGKSGGGKHEGLELMFERTRLEHIVPEFLYLRSKVEPMS